MKVESVGVQIKEGFTICYTGSLPLNKDIIEDFMLKFKRAKNSRQAIYEIAREFGLHAIDR